MYPQWKPQQGVREEEEEGEEYLSEGEDGRPCIKQGRKQTIGKNRKETEEICKPEGEGEEYLSEGEDGRPCIKWRKLRTTNSTGREKETMEEREEEEIRGEEKAKHKNIETRKQKL